MEEIITISGDESARLKERVKKLAVDKSYLQLVIRLMNNISAASGFEDAVNRMLSSIVEVVGGGNIVLYYTVNTTIYLVDVYGKKSTLARIDDDIVQKVFTSGKAVECEHEFSDTGMKTPEFTKAYTWAYPLLVGPELVGVLKMENLQIGVSELCKHLPIFFNFAALILKNTLGTEMLHLQAVELEQEVAERQMAQENLQEQAALLEEEIERRQEAQDELEQLNETLEQRVQQRTAELNERNAEVQKAYDDLKKVQAQLLQQDKMASVGQLAAGVAHEINNPMGFIISNLGSLGKYVEKLAAYLDADENILSGCDPAIRQMSAQERLKYKIDHIRMDMPNLISESSDGAQRVRKIVQDLKSFSRVDAGEFAAADINEGLESTLSIAWNELKYKTTVIKEYGQLPHVWCNMGQLNQVFLNVLVNAAHAIEDHGEIGIRTWEEDGTVKITISDTGGGIPPENLKRIFDPFFTTKEVGKGTGLGLAIAYDIVVNKHGGRIDVSSEAGVGTTFTITLLVAGAVNGGSQLAE